MKTRETGYKDYGFEQGEEKKLKEYCKNSGFSDHELLLNAAIETNPAIASDLYYTIVSGLSYESIDKVRYVPISKGDFYGYQRKCLYIFRDFLRIYGKW